MMTAVATHHSSAPPFGFGYETSSPSPTPGSKQGNNHALGSELEARLRQLEDFHLREVQLLTELRDFFRLGDKTNQVDYQRAALEVEIKELLRKKEATVSLIFESPELSVSRVPSAPMSPSDASASSTPSPLPSAPRPEAQRAYSLIMVQQPLDVVIANRYLSPTISVRITPVPEPGAKLVARVSLFHQSSNLEAAKTVDGRQDVLQGLKTATFDATGKAVFGKLKIVEVSSKHKHQAFYLQISVEDQASNDVIAQVRTTPFLVNSRPNKRKFACSSEPSSPKEGSPLMKRVRSSESFTSTQLSDDSDDEDYEPTKSPSHHSESSSLLVHDYNYVDITDLLVLPQKEAAKRLGISESMLCKRFKECTRRKWPYRYLRKIDKVISILNLHKSYGVIPKEDREKLEKLTREREECLRPVKIRITSCDKLPLETRLANESSPPPANEKKAPIAPKSLDDDGDEDEIPDDILETLGKMKSQPSPM